MEEAGESEWLGSYGFFYLISFFFLMKHLIERFGDLIFFSSTNNAESQFSRVFFPLPCTDPSVPNSSKQRRIWVPRFKDTNKHLLLFKVCRYVWPYTWHRQFAGGRIISSHCFRGFDVWLLGSISCSLHSPREQEDRMWLWWWQWPKMFRWKNLPDSSWHRANKK